jgi:tetratricopeptide (TPR) repeat protein
MDTNLYAQLHGLHRTFHPQAVDSQLEQAIQAYADNVAEEERERSRNAENGGIEGVEVRVARVRQQAVDKMHEHYATIERGFKVVGDALQDAGESIPEVSEERLSVFDDPDAFKAAQERGYEIYELLGYSFETMTSIYNVLDTLFQQQDFEKVRDGFSFMADISSKTPEYWKALGLAEIRLEHYAKAEEACLKALDLNPNDPDSYISCLHAYEKQEKFSEAEALCDKGIAYADGVEDAELKAILEDAKRELKADEKEEI